MESNVSIKCKCGYEHTDYKYIRFVRDRLNQPKAYCTRCNHRVFVWRHTVESNPGKKVMIR